MGWKHWDEGKFHALLLKTGQVTSYYAGDDGELELGIAPKYTVLTTGRYSGNVNITVNGKTHATSNARVQDKNTGVMWQSGGHSSRYRAYYRRQAILGTIYLGGRNLYLQRCCQNYNGSCRDSM